MKRKQDDTPGYYERREGAPTWRLVFVKELNELWMGGKAPVLLLIYTILLGILAYVFASNSELSLIPPQEMVFELLKAAIAVGLFISLVIGADSISGERERATLESLLLTPTSRRQIVLGKFLAAITPWPVAFAVTIPYMKVLAQENEVFGQAVPWGALMGTILAPAFTGMGMLASFWSNSNKTSMFTGLGLYVLFLLPTQLPGTAQTGQFGSLLQRGNPYGATTHMLARTLVDNRSFSEFWSLMTAPVVFAIIIYIILFVYASPTLRLEGGKASRLWTSLGRIVGLSMLLATILAASSTLAQEPLANEKTPGAVSVESQPLQITIDMDYATVKAGDHILYNTIVSNNGTEPTPNLCIAMNIINLDAAGDVVDPEDWSPQRTQYLLPLAPGKSSKSSWRVNAILDGDYLVYMVAIPEPKNRESTSRPAASSGIHLTVTPFTKLNPGGVLPYAIGGPVALILIIIVLYRIRRKSIDTGASSENAD